jgi:t-SNARE complex subunit (syntaxin)
MSEIYSIYESSFKTLCKKIDSILNVDEYNPKTLSELRINIQEINRLVKQMQLEINNLKITKKKLSREIEQNLKNYKNIVNEYNNKLVEIQDNMNKKNRYNKNINIEMANKDILIDEDTNTQNQGLIEDEYAQQEKINYIGRNVFDIEKIGNNISDNLYGQGEQMRNIRDNIINMNHEADVSNSLITKIMNQARRNKILMYGSGIIVVLIFIMVIIYKFK